MRKRKLYEGEKPFAYIAFNYADSAETEVLLDFLDGDGYRYWFNSKISPSERDITEISERLSASKVTVVVLTESSADDRLISAVVENTVARHCPIVIYMLEETEKVSEYLGEVLSKVTNVVVFRAAEASLESSVSVRQALSEAKGITEAQAVRFYEDGMKVFRSSESTPEDISEAMKNISYAAQNEYPPAMCFCGDLALAKARKGYDSYSSAVSYYRGASQKGNLDAISKRGRMIADGEGFAADAAAAVSYLAIAAVKGYADAQYRLAEMMDSGNGVTADRIEASSWYKKALAGGDRRAYMKLAYRYLNGDTLVKNVSLAAEYFEEAAKDGDKEAFLMLGKLYRDGIGVTANEQLSSEYFLKAAKEGMAEAQYNYALSLFKKKNSSEAFRWLNVAAAGVKEGESTLPEVSYELAYCYDKGRGTEQDRTTAFLYYHDAALAGHSKAKLAVAECYRKGIGVPINKKAAAFFDSEYDDR